MPWWSFRPSELDSWDEEYARYHLCDARDLGVMPVEVSRIIGSVGRWRDFDARFRLKNTATRQRYQIILEKMRDGYNFPPIHLYKIRDKYYVADGNHRVAAAKELGVAYLDARVQEYFPCGNPEEAIYWRERSAFEVATRIQSVEFTNPDSYSRLLSHIITFRKAESKRLGYEVGLPEATQIWLKEIDRPIRTLVRQDRLAQRFPERTEDDLVFYMIHHQIGLIRAVKGPEAVNYREAIARLTSAPGRTLMGRFRRFARDLEKSTMKVMEGFRELQL